MPTPTKKLSAKSQPKAPRTIKTIKVNLASQIVEAFESNNRVFRFECVSGDRDHPTDRGIFRVLWRAESHRSRAYDVQIHHHEAISHDWRCLAGGMPDRRRGRPLGIQCLPSHVACYRSGD
ncbi:MULTISPECIES: L,D-transpeptidase [Ralstonia solanacearum species complex]|uniref:L,D-transpeptidase n=1 Tax=Ralstonia solanacearum species complex TaxID=3116862 RepID=UPI001F09BBC2|nr:L,D-transpeptidase [Ralstonia solanacearum]